MSDIPARGPKLQRIDAALDHLVEWWGYDEEVKPRVKDDYRHMVTEVLDAADRAVPVIYDTICVDVRGEDAPSFSSGRGHGIGNVRRIWRKRFGSYRFTIERMNVDG